MALWEIKLIFELHPAVYVAAFVKPTSSILQVQRHGANSSVGRHHDIATLLTIIRRRTEIAGSPEQKSCPFKSRYDEQDLGPLNAECMPHFVTTPRY